MKKWKQLLVAFGIIAGVGAVALPAQPTYAVNVFSQCSGNSSSSVCKSTGDSFNTMIKTVINILLYVLGMVAVIMIIVGGVRYTTSNGDAGAVKSAKDTILYSVIGLIVAIMAYSIVNFVVSWF